MNRLYSISFARFTPIPWDYRIVDNAISRHGDWIRFHGFQWFLWTASTKLQVSETLNSSLLPGDQFIITSIEATAAQGMAPDWVWSWINDKMQRRQNELP